jgi:Protein of unknown function (DUF3307)
VSWVEIFAAFVVSHLVGDYLVQTDWQARNKRLGLAGDPIRRRALVSHVFMYTLCFVPVLIAMSDDLGAGVVWVAALIFVPHLIQDDGRLLSWFIFTVKGATEESAREIYTPVDQSFHILALFGLALAAGA